MGKDIRLIRIDGIVVPQNKTAIREALEVAPENIDLIRNDQGKAGTAPDRIKTLDSLKPGETIAFTDGAGKYYGKISRTFVDQRIMPSDDNPGGSKPDYQLDIKI